ncbi:MAG: zinc-binding dehydrogenase [Gemmatimonadota bacterium]
MKALVLREIGRPDRLEVAELPPPPDPGPGEVRVRIRMAALNRLDLFVANGLPGVPPSLPHVAGADGAGVVDAVGPGVTGVGPGDSVMINPGISCGVCPACRAGEQPLCRSFAILGEHRFGTFAEYVVVPAVNLAPLPHSFCWAEAAAFSLATLTAWRMLTTRARLAPGETVLIWGAGGGVALAAVQIARLAGAFVVVAGSSERKLETARRLGADVAIDHTAEDIVAEVRRLTGGRGADVVVDSVGEATWPTSLRALARGGRLVTCGATSGPMVGIDVRKLFWHQWTILGSTMGSHREYAAITALAQRGLLRPPVDSVIPLADAPAAYERLAKGGHTGKLVLEVTA